MHFLLTLTGLGKKSQCPTDVESAGRGRKPVPATAGTEIARKQKSRTEHTLGSVDVCTDLSEVLNVQIGTFHSAIREHYAASLQAVYSKAFPV